MIFDIISPDDTIVGSFNVWDRPGYNGVEILPKQHGMMRVTYRNLAGHTMDEMVPDDCTIVIRPSKVGHTIPGTPRVV